MAHAEGYALHVIMQSPVKAETWTATTTATSYLIPGSAIAEPGDYALTVVPFAANYGQSEGTGYFTVSASQREPLAPIVFTNARDGSILTEASPRIAWMQVPSASEYLVSLTDLTLQRTILSGHSVGTAPSCGLSLDTGHAYRLTVRAVPEDGDQNSPLCSEGQVEFSYRTIPAFSVTGVQCEGTGSDARVTWNAPVWPGNTGLKPDYYVVWLYGPGVEDGFPSRVAGDGASCVLPGDRLCSPGAYTIDVYACMYDSWSDASHRAASASLVLAPESVTIDSLSAADGSLLSGRIDISGTASGGVHVIRAELLNGQTSVALSAPVEVSGSYDISLAHYQTDEDAAYTARVHGFRTMSDAHDFFLTALCTASLPLKLETGDIIALKLRGTNALGKALYSFEGKLTYAAYTRGSIGKLDVYLDDVWQGYADPVGEEPAGSGIFRYDRQLTLTEGIHSLYFIPSGASEGVLTRLAVIRDTADAVMYAASSASLLDWPSASAGTRDTLSPGMEVLVRGTIGSYAYVQVNGTNAFIPYALLTAAAPAEVVSGSWTFRPVQNGAGMYICSMPVDRDCGRFKLVMAEGYPEANQATRRALDDPEDLFEYSPISRNYNQTFSFADDLRMEPGKTYHFTVVSEDTPLYSVIAYQMVYTYHPEGRVLLPLDNAAVDIWNGAPLEIRWGLSGDAPRYQVYVAIVPDEENGLSSPLVLHDRLYDLEDVRLDALTAGVTVTSEDVLAHPLMEDRFRSIPLPVTIQVIAWPDTF